MLNLGIKLFNKVLAINQGSRNLLAKYAGKSFYLNISGILHLKAIIDNNGFLGPCSTQTDYDSIITVPLDTATYWLDLDKIGLYKKINFSGDSLFGSELLEILANLHFSGLYNVSHSPIILTLANKIEQILKQLTSQVQLMYRNSTQSICEYLLYETEDLITNFEHERFCDNVDDLRDRTVHLEQQIARLSKI